VKKCSLCSPRSQRPCAKRCQSSWLTRWWTKKNNQEKKSQGGGEAQGVANPTPTQKKWFSQYAFITCSNCSYLSKNLCRHSCHIKFGTTAQCCQTECCQTECRQTECCFYNIRPNVARLNVARPNVAWLG
jgi:hypothetical protein